MANLILNTTFFRDFLFYYQIITAVFSTVYFSKYKENALKHIVILLWYTAFNEYLGICYSNYVNNNNAIVYNIKQIITFSFYFYLYCKVIENSFAKKAILSLSLLYFFWGLYYVKTKNIFNEYFDITFMVGATCVVTSIIFYFIEVLKSDKLIYINHNLLFWISIGLLIYYVPTIPFMIVRKYYSDSITIPYIYNIIYGLIFISNSIFIAGFIWSKKE